MIHLNCSEANGFEVSFIQPSEDDDAFVNVNSKERKVFYEGNNSPLEWFYCCDEPCVMVDIVYHDNHEDSASHLGRVDYLLFVIEAEGIVV